MLQKIKEFSFFLYLVAFFLIWYGVCHQWFIALDEQIYQFTQFFLSDFTTLIMKGFSFFGSAYWLVFCSFLLFFLLKKNIDRLYFVFVSLFSETVNLILKNWIQRPRPMVCHLVVEHSFSFPSGHAMGSTTFYGAIIYFIWKSTLAKKYKILVTIFLCFLILGICFSRLYLGVHYFSDVLAGVCLSVFLLRFLFWNMKKKLN